MMSIMMNTMGFPEMDQIKNNKGNGKTKYKICKSVLLKLVGDKEFKDIFKRISLTEKVLMSMTEEGDRLVTLQWVKKIIVSFKLSGIEVKRDELFKKVESK